MSRATIPVQQVVLVETLLTKPQNIEWRHHDFNSAGDDLEFAAVFDDVARRVRANSCGVKASNSQTTKRRSSRKHPPHYNTPYLA